MSRLCEVHDLGEVPYADALQLQERLAVEISNGMRMPTMLLLEHPPVYTIGRTGSDDDLLWDLQQRAENGIEVHKVDRGGEATYHGPGQLVGYPLMPLGPVDLTGSLPKTDYIEFIRGIESVIIRSLAHLGLVAGQIQGKTGVWIQPDVASRCPHCPPEARKAPTKLAAIGIKIDSRGVSRHGFALNVSPDMRLWDGIVACGMPEARTISLADLLEPVPDMQEIKQEVVKSFGREFGFSMQFATSQTLKTIAL
jgi:lipoate-protein ligase B